MAAFLNKTLTRQANKVITNQLGSKKMNGKEESAALIAGHLTLLNVNDYLIPAATLSAAVLAIILTIFNIDITLKLADPEFNASDDREAMVAFFPSTLVFICTILYLSWRRAVWSAVRAVEEMRIAGRPKQVESKSQDAA